MGPLHVLYSVGGAVLIRVAAAPMREEEEVSEEVSEVVLEEVLEEEEVSADTLWISKCNFPWTPSPQNPSA